MGYKRRGLSLAELRRQADEILTHKAPGREAALVIAENNYITELSGKKGFMGVKQIQAIQDLYYNDEGEIEDEFSLYMNIALRLYHFTYRLYEARDLFQARAELVAQRLHTLHIAKELRHIGAQLIAQEEKVENPSELQKIGDSLRMCLSCSGITMTRRGKEQLTEGAFFLNTPLQIKKMNEALIEYAAYCRAVDIFLQDKDIADFVPDAMISGTQLLYKNFVPNSFPLAGALKQWKDKKAEAEKKLVILSDEWSKQKAEIEEALSEARKKIKEQMKKFAKNKDNITEEQYKKYRDWLFEIQKKRRELEKSFKEGELLYSKQATPLITEIKSYEIFIFYGKGYANFPSVKEREAIKNSIPDAKIKRLTDKIYLGK